MDLEFIYEYEKVKQFSMIQPSKIKPIEFILKEYSKEPCIIIDVRSESEFAEDNIPGSINLPVLNNIERAEVGTEYKANPFYARQLGAKLIASNLRKNLESIEEFSSQFDNHGATKHKPDCHFIIYCWRGGMRSRSLFTVMDLIGYKTTLIDGGYQSYRRHINLFFQEGILPKAISIYGPSGSGKSELIQNISKEKLPAIHLEKYANHKGSLFGETSFKQPSQKMFESFIYQGLIKNQSTFMILEGESKKIGKLLLPERFHAQMKLGKKIWVELPLELRAKRISEEYTHSDSNVLNKLSFLKKYMTKGIFSKITNAINDKDRYTAALLLLKHHYDDYYLKGSPDQPNERVYERIFKCDSFEELNKKVMEYFLTEKAFPD